jgi:hypothetical protein
MSSRKRSAPSGGGDGSVTGNSSEYRGRSKKRARNPLRFVETIGVVPHTAEEVPDEERTRSRPSVAKIKNKMVRLQQLHKMRAEVLAERQKKRQVSDHVVWCCDVID